MLSDFYFLESPSFLLTSESSQLWRFLVVVFPISMTEAKLDVCKVFH